MKAPVADVERRTTEMLISYCMEIYPLSYVWVSRKAWWEAARLFSSLLGSQLSLGPRADVAVYQASAPSGVRSWSLLHCRLEFRMAIL